MSITGLIATIFSSCLCVLGFKTRAGEKLAGRAHFKQTGVCPISPNTRKNIGEESWIDLREQAKRGMT